ncbi:uncharacterized protein LOC119458776 [Dermacentor silvarum]|uniref:uncharacterized protein LOC119458776 n=1 Tax=Dermacentor silvarum TaxID=543639 RepID=UPI00189B774D|nr:uncharacterized protein LOC119458776 [Dermacentor silvarum]
MRMDAAEAEDNAKGAGDQESANNAEATTKTEGGTEGVLATPQKKDEPSGPPEELEKGSENRPVSDDTAYVAEGGDPAPDSDAMDVSGNAPFKRPLDATDGKATPKNHADGPPAKSTMIRRSSFKPCPNIPRDRKEGDKPPPTTDHARPPDGPGGV